MPHTHNRWMIGNTVMGRVAVRNLRGRYTTTVYARHASLPRQYSSVSEPPKGSIASVLADRTGKSWTVPSHPSTRKQNRDQSNPLGLLASQSNPGTRGKRSRESNINEISAIEMLSAPDTSSSSWFYVPSVLTHQEEPLGTRRPDVIHILGNDARSTFLAHALAQIYGSVRMIKRMSREQEKYKNVMHPNDKLVPNKMNKMHAAKLRLGDDERIKNLVVTKSPGETIDAIQPLQDLIDDKTAICLMQDGLGLAEALNEQVFPDEKSRPQYVLGHMSMDIKYDRNTASVRSFKGGETILTDYAPDLHATLSTHAQSPVATQLMTEAMLQNLGQAKYLQAASAPFDRWLHMKLPSLAFASVIDPVCVMMDCAYSDIMQNKAGMRVVNDLLKEICLVVANLPEVQHSVEIQRLVGSQALRKAIFSQLKSKRYAQSQMVRQVREGKATDIDYLNGYFVNRAKSLGIETPVNEMIVDMVRAKRQVEKMKIDAEIPFEEVSTPKPKPRQRWSKMVTMETS